MTRGEYAWDDGRATSSIPTTTVPPGGRTPTASRGRRLRRGLHGGRLRVDRLRLSRRTAAVPMADGQLLLSASWTLRLSEGALLYPSGDVVEEQAVLAVPHWNWPGKEGQPIKVSGHVEYRDRGASIERPARLAAGVDLYEMNDWQVPYAPGRLEAVGKTGGGSCAYAVETTGAPVRLKLTPDRAAARQRRPRRGPVTVEALDSRGRPWRRRTCRCSSRFPAADHRRRQRRCQ